MMREPYRQSRVCRSFAKEVSGDSFAGRRIVI
jgi:hypothetical protein